MSKKYGIKSCCLNLTLVYGVTKIHQYLKKEKQKRKPKLVYSLCKMLKWQSLA